MVEKHSSYTQTVPYSTVHSNSITAKQNGPSLPNAQPNNQPSANSIHAECSMCHMKKRCQVGLGKISTLIPETQFDEPDELDCWKLSLRLFCLVNRRTSRFRLFAFAFFLRFTSKNLFVCFPKWLCIMTSNSWHEAMNNGSFMIEDIRGHFLSFYPFMLFDSRISRLFCFYSWLGWMSTALIDVYAKKLYQLICSLCLLDDCS